MGYEKLRLENGVVLNADHLAHIEEGISDASEFSVYCAEYGVTTYAEIKAAVDAGKLCFCKRDNILVPLYDVTSARIRFINATPTLNVWYYAVTSANSWSNSGYALQGISGRVQTINSASTSTSYPSTKAVYDFVHPIETELGEKVSFWEEQDLTEEQKAVARANIGAVSASEASSAGIEPTEDDIPKVFIDGTIPTTKDDVLAEMQYISKTESFKAYIKIKCQGSSSMSYDKKNFTVKMYSDEARENELKKVFKDWGYESSKYVLKANWIDHSHARNIVSARIWDEVVSRRADYDTLPEEMRNSPRNGAVDGFPIKVYTNGTYQGVYTWNIGKDDWMWGMDEDNTNHALLCAEVNNNGEEVDTAANFRVLWEGDHAGDWKVEIGEKSDAVIVSLNALISCVKDTDDGTFKATIGNYLDIQSAIDYWIHQYIICGLDGLGKNLLLATYDKTKWICGAYDMDSTFGLHYGGSHFVSPEFKCPEDYQENRSLLWERISTLYAAEVLARYTELRKTVYSYANLFTHFERFIDIIGRDLYDEDLVAYTGIPSGNTNNIKQIRDFIRDRLYYCDVEFGLVERGIAYGLDNGHYEWTVGSVESSNLFLDVINGNHVKFYSQGVISASTFVNISNPTANTANHDSFANMGVGNKRFSLSAGDEVRVVITHTSGSKNDAINIYLASSAISRVTILDNVGGNADATYTVEEDMDVVSVGMYAYFWGGGADAVCRYEFDIEIYVNGTQYV
jgi:hypothetical protein